MVLGYRLFRVTLFGVGFAFGGSVVALILEHVFAAESWVTTASFVGFVVATAGVLLAMVLNDSICYMLYPSQPDLVLASLCVVFGLLSGVLALMLEKPVLIIATSLFGAGLLVWGVGYFAGDFPTFINLKEYAIQDDQGEWMYTIPGSWMAYFIGFTVLFVLGMLIQFRKSSRRGRYHKRHTRGRKTRNAPYVQA
ncbi:hypothetical protein BBO99_00004397 [Phytophthora kernoviae]|uniref:Transmembrane protein 198 n=2 Tax=Phytophthora kernoviae TaxID=325452 RepID=A0A421GS75_9STRA|nr:hypothetical protein G195_010394 [Phytophthora kernoviae 00238/432]KAG2508046.1 hypothetical protein JM16_008906 [Phytophthora kernoviae]KAG2510626.1 hypothetical protein JM18_008937 [Phytophthora kernoviae]RLN15316.1 hypothetical protein BBI17_004568 [Phytophthora kernoviae]RLN80595.1 hypothetical protein BBO99_00004397 [Phytophthora kernoviae]